MSDERFDQRLAARVAPFLAEEYLAGIRDMDAATLRAKRRACEVEEHRVSYARRILQGRIDVLHAEANRRGSEQSAGVLHHLADVLADHGQRAFDPATARPPATIEADDLGDDVEVEGPAALADLDDDGLRRLAARYADQERTVSRIRRGLFDVIDRLQAEIADRYRRGTASVSELLAGD